MKLEAYPKINLCLKVYKGWFESKHVIDSIFMLYKKIHDTIYIKKSNDLFVYYEEQGKQIEIPDCLVTKSLKYLQSKYDVDIKYMIKIIKRIPFGSGLGGGSADAAAVINYILKQNKQIQLDLKDIVIELGSDLPFFLSNYKIARVKQIGESVSPIYDWKPKVDLRFSPIFCDTQKVFESLENDSSYVSRVNVDHIIQHYLCKQPLTNVIHNDLTKYIIENYKELRDVYKEQTSQSFFTGAGSTIVIIKG